MDKYFGQHEMPRRPHLVQGKAGVAGEVDDLRKDLQSAFARVEADMEGAGNLVTTGVQHLWADGDIGDDNNDGLTEATPKKTILGVAALFPLIIKHPTIANLRGTFSEFAQIRGLMVNDRILFDGGPDTVVVSGPHVADIATSTHVGLSTLSMTTDEHFGYWIRFLDGPLAGLRYSVNANDATSFRTNRNFSPVPQVGDSFQIERPATQILSTGGYSGIQCIFNGRAQINYSRLHFFGPNAFVSLLGAIPVMQGCVLEQTGSAAGTAAVFEECDSVNLGFATGVVVSDPNGSILVDSTYRVGTSFRANGRITVTSSSAMYSEASQFQCSELGINSLRKARFRRGVRIRGATRIASSQLYNTEINTLDSDASYPPIQFDGATQGDGNGLTLIASSLIAAGPENVEFNGNAGHGVELRAGSLLAAKSDVVLAGSGNGGAGAYVNSGSQLLLQDGGSRPTVTGTAGELAISDPAAQETTWADVYDSNNPATVLSELSVVKKKSGAF
jgi:hypothetical protein